MDYLFWTMAAGMAVFYIKVAMSAPAPKEE